MDIVKLRTFHQVAKLGSLTAASKKLKYSVSNISRQLSGIEKSLDANLFYKNKNKFVLTPQGEFLFHKTTELLKELNSIKSLVQDNVTPSGLLRITTTQGLASAWLPLYAGEFLTQFPHIELSIHGDDQRMDIAFGDADVAITAYMENKPEFCQVPLLTTTLGLYASAQYLEKFGIPKSIEDLDHHKLIGRSHQQEIPYKSINWQLMVGREGKPHRKPCILINSINGMEELALQGLGIASLYTEKLFTPRQNQLIRILPEITSPPVEIVYIYPKKLEGMQKINCLKEFLLGKIAAEGKKEGVLPGHK